MDIDFNSKIFHLIVYFIENADKIFSCDDVVSFIRGTGTYCNTDEIENDLNSLCTLLQIDKNHFCSRPMMFENALFAIQPTKNEIDGGYLIIGHRTMPFTNPQLFPDNLVFFDAGKTKINKIRKSISVKDATLHYRFFGDDIMAQIMQADNIALEPLDECENNDEISLNEIVITVLDMEKFYKKHHFCYGDKIICVNRDWFEGTINIAALREENRESPFLEVQSKREMIKQYWTKIFEENMLENIKNGKICKNIEEQLAMAYLLNPKLKDLPYAESIEDLIFSSNKLEIVPFGISSRIWQKKAQIIGIFKWDDPFTKSKISFTKDEDCNIYKLIALHIDDIFVDAYIKDSLFYEKDVNYILDSIIPDFIVYDNDDYTDAILKLEKKRATIKSTYSMFADYVIAEYRHQILSIFNKIVAFLHEIRLSKIDTTTLTQQPLFVIQHLTGHISKTIFWLYDDDEISKDDMPITSDTIEGMQCCLEENSNLILDEIKSRHNNLTITCISGENDE